MGGGGAMEGICHCKTRVKRDPIYHLPWISPQLQILASSLAGCIIGGMGGVYRDEAMLYNNDIVLRHTLAVLYICAPQ